MKCSQQCISEKQTKDTMFWHRRSHRNDQWGIAGENVLSFWGCDDKKSVSSHLVHQQQCVYTLTMILWFALLKRSWGRCMSEERNRFSLKAKKHKNDTLLSILIDSRSCAHLFLLSFECWMVVLLGEINKNFLE